MLVRPPCGTCATVHNMELALGLASRLVIGVTMSPTMSPRKNVERKSSSGTMQLIFSLSTIRSHRTRCFVCTARSSPRRRCLTMAARKPARPGRLLIGEGPRFEVPPHTKGVDADRSAGWERTKAATTTEQKHRLCRCTTCRPWPRHISPALHLRCTPLLGAYTYCTMQRKANPPPSPSSP